MDQIYKLQVKLGPAEFNAEGPQDAVKSDYEKFLEALSHGQRQPDQPNLNGNEKISPDVAVADADSAALQRVFSGDQKKGIVSLRLLPPDGPNRAADAAILILFGFSKLFQQREVPVTRLKASLVLSGIHVDRLDRFMGTHAGLVIKGGARIGGRYSLNNQGIAQAQVWLAEWFS
jgi:hypothetical protein